eukprot:TRINITY_DN367_c0_g1_i2.p2 TRINITY_DN367_c0_g1~~TRINITY_DN367_c0_g1_i2.p2  ORF type:complete len:334 (+),score=42.58 TRINITY_DN367_c0_g1_i2:458-1459(+)
MSLSHAPSEFTVCVGQIVKLRSQGSVPNWHLYVTELHCSGLGEPGGAGYFVYRDTDIRKFRTCSSFTCDEKEYFPTYHKFNFVLSNILEVVDVRPEIFYNPSRHTGFFRSFFDIKILALRRIDFEDENDPFALVRGLQTDELSRNPCLFSLRGHFQELFFERLHDYCDKKGAPKTPSSPNFWVSLPSLSSLLCLPDSLLSSSTFTKNNQYFYVKVEKASGLDGFMGKKWNVVSRLAKSTGTERLRFVVVPPITFIFPVEGFQFKVLLGGLKKFNGSGTLQWDTTSVRKRQRRSQTKHAFDNSNNSGAGTSNTLVGMPSDRCDPAEDDYYDGNE